MKKRKKEIKRMRVIQKEREGRMKRSWEIEGREGERQSEREGGKKERRKGERKGKMERERARLNTS